MTVCLCVSLSPVCLCLCVCVSHSVCEIVDTCVLTSRGSVGNPTTLEQNKMKQNILDSFIFSGLQWRGHQKKTTFSTVSLQRSRREQQVNSFSSSSSISSVLLLLRLQLEAQRGVDDDDASVGGVRHKTLCEFGLRKT